MFDTLLSLLSPARLLGRLTSQDPAPATIQEQENDTSPNSDPVPPARRRRRRRPRRPSERTAQDHAENIAAPRESDVDVRGTASFGDLPVSGAMGRTLQEIAYLEPTPVQCEVIPLMLASKDVVGQAQTGTGKTAAFGIPLAEMLDARLDAVP